MAKFAYADPPYLGQGARHYGALHADAADCDSEAWHKALIERLCDEFPDGWALSLHTPSLKTMLNLCPDDVRVGAWVKPFAAFKKNVTRADGGAAAGVSMAELAQLMGHDDSATTEAHYARFSPDFLRRAANAGW